MLTTRWFLGPKDARHEPAAKSGMPSSDHMSRLALASSGPARPIRRRSRRVRSRYCSVETSRPRDLETARSGAQLEACFPLAGEGLRSCVGFHEQWTPDFHEDSPPWFRASRDL